MKTCYEYFLIFLSFVLTLKYYILFSFFKNRSGLAETERGETPLIVSFTSFPERIPSLYLVAETLLRQTLKPEQIFLWLSKEEFPNLKKDLPKNLLAQESRGLTIKFCKKNTGPYKKLIHTLKGHPKANIVTVDDDIYYPRYLLEMLMESHKSNPNDVIGGICMKIKLKTPNSFEPYDDWTFCSKNERSFFVLSAGVGGVLYPPNSLHKEIFNEKKFLKLCPSSDDIWFKAMSLRKNIKNKQTERLFQPFYVPKSQKKGLFKTNIECKMNDKSFKKVFDEYDLFKKLTDK